LGEAGGGGSGEQEGDSANRQLEVPKNAEYTERKV
jgi:hypothetical protein